MINHTPAQLIAELRRLMDMDYERLPGARHVLEEAIAVIRPLAEKSDVGEMIDPLRALVAQWRQNEQELCRKADTSTASLAERLAYRADAFGKCADELDTLLSAPVVPPSTLRDTLELDGHPVETPIRVAGFLRHYAGMIRRNERWDVPETMANTYESAALQLEKYHAMVLSAPVVNKEP